MISRYSVSLNGISLETLHDSILILDVSYAAPTHTYSRIKSAKREGSRVYNNYKEKAMVTISFAIRAYDIARRQNVCQTVCKWAKNGGTLEINDRVGQILKCVCETLPSVTSVKKWTDTFTIVFIAYNTPYWQEKTKSMLTLTGTTGNGLLYVPGSAPNTVVEVVATPIATLTSLALTVAGKTITLSGIEVASGKNIVIGYDDEMIQSIKADGTSIMSKRTGADDLMAECGTYNTVSFTADASCSVTFSARGLWE